MEASTLFGVLGVIANVLWPLIKKRRLLLAGQVLACIFMCLHFLLLEAYTGASIMFVAGVQATLAIPLESYPKFKIVYIASIVSTFLVCWYTWQGLPSIFSSLALILFCIGNLQVNTKLLRVFLLLCLCSWVGHNILIASYPALVSNALALVTSVFALIRELKPNKALNQPKTRKAESAAH